MVNSYMTISFDKVDAVIPIAIPQLHVGNNLK
jgi:hypothetical protein